MIDLIIEHQKKIVQIGALLNYIMNWGFWSEDENDYYVTEDGQDYYVLESN